MADIQGTMTAGSQVVAKAGSAYSILYNPFMASGIVRAEGTIMALTRYDWNSGLAADTTGSAARGILNDVASSLVANEAIVFDMNDYPSRIVAEDMINVNRDTALRGLAILRDEKTREFLQGV